MHYRSIGHFDAFPLPWIFRILQNHHNHLICLRLPNAYIPAQRAKPLVLSLNSLTWSQILIQTSYVVIY